MSTNNWLVPLNLHHSLKLRTLAKNSQELYNISNSLYGLTNSILTLEQSSIELTGTANAILDLLQSEQHKQQAIAAMRSLIYNHLSACESALSEEDSLTAYSSCVISNRMLNQPWFDSNLFSYASFEEMKYASESLSRCQDIMIQIWSKLNEEERSMMDLFINSLNELDQLRLDEIKAVKPFSELYFGSGGWWNNRGLIIKNDEIFYAFRDKGYIDFPFSEVIPHSVDSSKYEGSAERWNDNDDNLRWKLATIDLNGHKDSRFPCIYTTLNKRETKDFTIEDWEVILNRIKLISLNSGDENLPQELIDLINKKENPGSFFLGTGRWDKDHVDSVRLTGDEINDFYSRYNAWKQCSLRTVTRRKEILKTCNNSFKGRLEIQT